MKDSEKNIANILIVNDDKSYLEEFVNYLKKKHPRMEITEVITASFAKGKFYTKKKMLMQLVWCFCRLGLDPTVLSGRRFDSVLLKGVMPTLSYLVLTKLFPFIKPKKNIVITFFFLHSLSGKWLIKRLLKFVLNDRKVVLTLYSRSDKRYFAETVGIKKAKVMVIPYCQAEAETNDECGKGEDYIFTGGYSNRDYNCLLKAAKKVRFKFIIACSNLNKVVPISDNVQVIRNLDLKSFNGYMKNSAILVIPLQHDVGSAGLSVTLFGMSLKKAIIYSDMDCLADYFTEGVSGIAYKKGDADNLASKIEHLLADRKKRTELGNSAFERYRKLYHRLNYYNLLGGCC